MAAGICTPVKEWPFLEWLGPEWWQFSKKSWVSLVVDYSIRYLGLMVCAVDWLINWLIHPIDWLIDWLISFFSFDLTTCLFSGLESCPCCSPKCRTEIWPRYRKRKPLVFYSVWQSSFSAVELSAAFAIWRPLHSHSLFEPRSKNSPPGQPGFYLDFCKWLYYVCNPVTVCPPDRSDGHCLLFVQILCQIRISFPQMVSIFSWSLFDVKVPYFFGNAVHFFGVININLHCDNPRMQQCRCFFLPWNHILSVLFFILKLRPSTLP